MTNRSRGLNEESIIHVSNALTIHPCVTVLNPLVGRWRRRGRSVVRPNSTPRETAGLDPVTVPSMIRSFVALSGMTLVIDDDAPSEKTARAMIDCEHYESLRFTLCATSGGIRRETYLRFRFFTAFSSFNFRTPGSFRRHLPYLVGREASFRRKLGNGIIAL
jgi:hypothetical protein